MAFYRIKKTFSTAWVNSNSYKLDNIEYYSQQIIGNIIHDSSDPIYLVLDNLDEQTNLQLWDYLDYHPWNFGSLQATCMVISNSFRELISRELMLPQHKLYNAEIYNPKTGETRTNYSILHLTHNMYEEIDLNESIFGTFSLDDNQLKSELERGYIKSQNDLDIEVNNQIELSNSIIKPIKIVFKPEYNFDIISIDLKSSLIYVSSRTRQLILDNPIKGVEFKENNPNNIWMTGPEIVMNDSL